MAHVLLDQAHKYDVPVFDGIPNGCVFSQSKGYWISIATGQPMMEGKDPKPPVSKKCDRESGEDQKGE